MQWKTNHVRQRTQPVFKLHYCICTRYQAKSHSITNWTYTKQVAVKNYMKQRPRKRWKHWNIPDSIVTRSKACLILSIMSYSRRLFLICFNYIVVFICCIDNIKRPIMRNAFFSHLPNSQANWDSTFNFPDNCITLTVFWWYSAGGFSCWWLLLTAFFFPNLALYYSKSLDKVKTTDNFSLPLDLEGVLASGGNIRAVWNLVREKWERGKVFDACFFLCCLACVRFQALKVWWFGLGSFVCSCTFCLLNFMCLSKFLISCRHLITSACFFSCCFYCLCYD